MRRFRDRRIGQRSPAILLFDRNSLEPRHAGASFIRKILDVAGATLMEINTSSYPRK
jgi:hypothetical protein